MFVISFAFVCIEMYSVFFPFPSNFFFQFSETVLLVVNEWKWGRERDRWKGNERRSQKEGYGTKRWNKCVNSRRRINGEQAKWDVCKSWILFQEIITRIRKWCRRQNQQQQSIMQRKSRWRKKNSTCQAKKLQLLYKAIIFQHFVNETEYCHQREPNTIERHPIDTSRNCFQLSNKFCWFYFLSAVV